MTIKRFKMGRPPLSSEVRRGRSVMTRLTESQYAKLRKAAKAGKVSMSVYLANLLENK